MTNPNIQLIIDELNEIKITMLEVKKAEKNIEMDRYTNSLGLFKDAENIASCGTPCCVAGWHALRQGLRAYDGDERLSDLSNSHPFIAQMLFAPTPAIRMVYAEEAEFPNADDYNHLNKTYPKPDDVITLINDLIPFLLENHNDI